MKDNIALIGFMATGKTAVGSILATRLGKKFIELDALIEKLSSRTIPRIFAEDGEEAFRRLEMVALEEALKGNNLIISCGGGVVLRSANTELLKRKAVVVLLTASPETLLRRALKDGSTRPLLNVEDKPGKIKELLALRQPLYDSAADITLDNTELDVTATADTIIDRLKQDDSSNR